MKTGAVRNSSRTCTYLCYAQQNDCESKAFGCSQFQKGKREKKTFAIVVPFSAVCRLLLFVREIEDAATNKERGESEPIPKYRINDDSVM